MAQPLSPETVAVAGYAAVFGQPDLTGDIIRPGAFQQSIKKMRKLIPAPSSRVMMLYQHAADRPVGCWDELKEDSHGLFVRGHLFADTRDGRDLVQLLCGRAVNGLSIGFRPRRARRGRDGRRELFDIDLWEISIVTFPMAPGARLTEIGSPSRKPRNLLHTTDRGQ
ncbi:HK97 family phage prohead protease [Parvularcula marina]|uniref:HK97 family phage prohead protease n=1 Tax=Parvularcula marina TaxID=2292771 RepID=UPI003517103B